MIHKASYIAHVAKFDAVKTVNSQKFMTFEQKVHAQPGRLIT